MMAGGWGWSATRIWVSHFRFGIAGHSAVFGKGRNSALGQNTTESASESVRYRYIRNGHGLLGQGRPE